MPRLIDADEIPFVESEDGVLKDYAFRYDINELPTINSIPEVHGKWEYYSSEMIRPHFRCSACYTPRYEHYAANDFKYCPNCGAKMDLK